VRSWSLCVGAECARRGWRMALLVFALAAAAGACRGNNPEYGKAYAAPVGGDAARGAQLIGNTGCGACHTIPGIRGAHGLVGPPLLWFSRRTYIAGEVPNTPENLIRWVQSPKSIEPATAMPTAGLSEQQARDVAAYLYTLR
jgi:mono/diheme cytochrome c family protein